ncbi:hypothetical protein ACOKW7_24885 [Limnospira platensis CENA597]|uniref:hypothetical protein n=1 Tax=Limnospira platensis TaxID=118562 RepID=UPI003D9FF253
MPLNDVYNKYKTDFDAKLGTSKGPCLGPELMVEAPVDKTSKYVIPMPMLLLYRLSSNSQGLEPTEVRDLTIWRPAPKGNTGTSNANRRKVPIGLRRIPSKKTGFYRVFVEGPAIPVDTGIWRKYTTSGTNPGDRKLRFITLKVPPVFSINCLLYVFAHYWTIKPLSLRTHHSYYQIPDKNDYPLDGLGELTTGKTEAPNQVQGNLPADESKKDKRKKGK